MSYRFTPPEGRDSQTLHQVPARRAASRGEAPWIVGETRRREQLAMKTIRTTTIAAALIAMVMMTCVSAAVAAGNAQGLKASVEQGMERLVGAVIEAVGRIEASSEGEREEAVRAVVEDIVMPNVDTATIARRIVGKRHWANATRAQRATLTTMIGQWIGTTYARTIAGYSGEAVVLDHEATQMGSTKARIRFGITIGGKVTNMGFELGIDQAGERWMIRDLDVEGISTVRMQRANFRPVLAKRGIDGAIDAWEAMAAGGGAREGYAGEYHWAPVVINVVK